MGKYHMTERKVDCVSISRQYKGRRQKMEKERLIRRAEQREHKPGIGGLGYPRRTPEIAKTSTAIIKAICGQENVTPFIAKHALKMAAEIIDDEAQHEAIQ